MSKERAHLVWHFKYIQKFNKYYKIVTCYCIRGNKILWVRKDYYKSDDKLIKIDYKRIYNVINEAR